MSFFERMMRINQAEQHRQKWFNEEAEDLRLSVSRGNQEKQPLRNSSRRLDDDQMPDVPQEPKPQQVYVSVKPVLLTYLLPKRQQLLREMLAKKREFELKKITNSNMRKHCELKQRLEQSSFKLIHSSQCPKQAEQPHPLPDHSNTASMKSLQNNPNPSVPESTNSKHRQKRKKSLKESLVLDISESSTQKNIFTSNVIQHPNNDPLNRQIMMRLLNMLENERNDRKDFMAMSINNHLSHVPHPHEKEAPIIINNILKTPVDALNKDLMERQMKIKILENNRSKQKSFFNFGFNAGYTEQKSDNPLTQRSEAPKCNEFNGTAHQNPHLNTKGKGSLQCSRISIQSKKVSSAQEVTPKCEEKQTKPSSNFSSQVTEKEVPSKTKDTRQRNFNRNKNSQNESKCQNNLKEVHLQIEKKQEPSNRTSDLSETIIHKASIRLDIPLNESSDAQGLTLAEAFKKRIGKLKSEKEKTNKQKSIKKKVEGIVINDQNFVKTEIYPQYTTPKDAYVPLFPLESNQTINIAKESTRTKRINHNVKSMAKEKQNTNSKNSREPSKELIDRLIGGERAKISKKQMYALTRKNYQNLPEIQAKKKEQQKKRFQQERLAKIREMQRSTRSLKQVKMTLE